MLAEAFVGGLSRSRVRLLLGRVVAARLMTDGATFVDTFRELHDTWGFRARTAFTITLRIYRGGGLTKDAVYVRGIGQLMDYIREGGDLESLLIGKIAVEHVSLIQELKAREILVPPPLKPSFLEAPEFQPQMDRIRSGLTLFQLLRDKAEPASGEAGAWDESLSDEILQALRLAPLAFAIFNTGRVTAKVYLACQPITLVVTLSVSGVLSMGWSHHVMRFLGNSGRWRLAAACLAVACFALPCRRRNRSRGDGAICPSTPISLAAATSIRAPISPSIRFSGSRTSSWSCTRFP